MLCFMVYRLFFSLRANHTNSTFYSVSTLVILSLIYEFTCFLNQQPTHATYLKIPESKASFLIGVLSVGSLFGRLFFGHISDYRWINRLNLYQTALLVMAVTTTLCPLATTYGGLIAYTLLFGIFDGAFVALIAVLTGDIVGSHKLPSALGFLYLVFSVPITTGSLIAGVYLLLCTGNPTCFSHSQSRQLFAASRLISPCPCSKNKISVQKDKMAAKRKEDIL